MDRQARQSRREWASSFRRAAAFRAWPRSRSERRDERELRAGGWRRGQRAGLEQRRLVLVSAARGGRFHDAGRCGCQHSGLAVRLSPQTMRVSHPAGHARLCLGRSRVLGRPAPEAGDRVKPGVAAVYPCRIPPNTGMASLYGLGFHVSSAPAPAAGSRGSPYHPRLRRHRGPEASPSAASDTVPGDTTRRGALRRGCGRQAARYAVAVAPRRPLGPAATASSLLSALP